MNQIIRYAIQMRNGDYMLQDMHESIPQAVIIRTVDNPIDATLLKNKNVAERCITEILSGNTNLLCLYDDDNPPKEVIELNISFTES